MVGHIDEIGLIVHHIDDDGFLWFTGVGGWDPIVLVGQRVELSTRGGVVPGVVGKKPIHLMKDEDRKKGPELKHLHIDIGAASGDEARALVRIGDVAVIAGEPVEFPGGRYVSRSMDNRLGCLRRPRGGAAGRRGRRRAGRRVRRGGRAGGDHLRRLAHHGVLAAAGRGHRRRRDVRHRPAGHLRAGAGQAPLRLRGGADPRLDAGPDRCSSCCYETAEAEGIPFTVDASARATGTDADAIHISRGGIPSAVVSVPLRYMHSPVEMVQLDDVEAAAKLIAAFALRLPADADFRR